MKIKRFTAGILESNGYVIYQRDGGECYVIDPGYKPSNFIDFIGDHNLKLKGILLTHGHIDHVGAVNRVKAACPCSIYLHRLDADNCRREADIHMEDGDVFMLEDEEIKVIHTPGHTKGGVCFFSDKSKAVFTGDTLFDDDVGRTDLEGGSDRELEETMRSIINCWGNDITIYPGHGESLGMKKVRKQNREFLAIIE